MTQRKASYEADEIGKLVDICHSNLKNSPELQEYLRKRGMDKYLIDKYKIGFFPQNLNMLSKYVNFDLLKSKNIIRTNGTSDFSEYHTLIFPIFNEYDEAVGISGRATINSEAMKNLGIPKYKNSSYKKANILYGFNSNLDSIISKKSAFIVEGYFDQIALQKNGIKNSVAICGTAFSKGHYMKLRRYCDKLYFLLDNDDAGFRSSQSIFKKFGKYGLDMKFLKCTKEEYKDIDEYFSCNSISTFKKDFKVINLF